MKAQEQKSPRRRPSAATAANEAAVNAPEDADHRVKVAMAAYFIAEKRNFEPGHELDDWLAAEAAIDNAAAVVLKKPIQLSPVGSAT
jgi:hypothetical protein